MRNLSEDTVQISELSVMSEARIPGNIASQKKISIQEGARELRYNFFETLRLLKGFDKIATAHNANDNAETVLLNLFRGSGVNGLAGIQVKRGSIIRPLLFATREEIEKYAEAKGLSFRIDSSNLKTSYRRNYIRQKICP
jgi:tRNA(Ile)-lysidine synthase